MIHFFMFHWKVFQGSLGRYTCASCVNTESEQDHDVHRTGFPADRRKKVHMRFSSILVHTGSEVCTYRINSPTAGTTGTHAVQI